MPTPRQVAALPLRRAKNGALKILLVTSRETGRWIIPKGWSSKRMSNGKAAAREAKQEAGVEGRITPKAIGRYRYIKRELGQSSPVEVAVYLLSVKKQWKRWPEKRERRRAWFYIAEAAAKVDEPELASLIYALQVTFVRWTLAHLRKTNPAGEV
jgi:8-oxo-dGTP pyrophosphatase MutT (NUDIX family)